jgi:hypothetical protein
MAPTMRLYKQYFGANQAFMPTISLYQWFFGSHFVYLKAWTLVLQQSVAHRPDGRILRSPYQQWVFHESLRRAILVSILLQCVYDAIKTGDCTAPFLSRLPMSTNGSLWLMPEDEWWGSTRGHASHLVTYREFVDQC